MFSKIFIQKKKTIYYDESATFRQANISGIKKTTDRVRKFLPKYIVNDGYRLVSVVGENGRYRRLHRLFGFTFLGFEVIPCQGDIFLSVSLNASSQLTNRERLLQWKHKGVVLIAFVYDLVFIKFPEFVAPGGGQLC